MSLSKEQVQHIALLARLSLEEKDIDDVVDKLSSIVDFVDQLQAAPTDDVVPMAHPLDQAQRLRADVVTEQDQHTLFQAQAPQVEADLIDAEVKQAEIQSKEVIEHSKTAEKITDRLLVGEQEKEREKWANRKDVDVEEIKRED